MEGRWPFQASELPETPPAQTSGLCASWMRLNVIVLHSYSAQRRHAKEEKAKSTCGHEPRHPSCVGGATFTCVGLALLRGYASKCGMKRTRNAGPLQATALETPAPRQAVRLIHSDECPRYLAMCSTP